MQLRILIVMFFLGNSLPSYSTERWDISGYQGYSTGFVNANVEFYETPRKIEMIISDDMSTPERLLSVYYSNLINKNIDAVKLLYSESDGSRDRFSAALANKKLILDRYVNLAGVFITEKIKWGDYYYISLRMKSKDGRSLSWRETLVCESKCQIIFNFFDFESEQLGIIDFVRSTYWNSKELDSMLNLKGGRTGFTMVNIFPIGAKITSSKDPISINFKFKKIGMTIGDDDDLCHKKISKNYNGLCAFIGESRSLDFSMKDKTSEFFIKYWRDADPEDIKVNVQEGHSLAIKDYVPLAFVQYVKNMASIKVVASLDVGRVRYLIYQPAVNGENDEIILLPMQVLMFSILEDGSAELNLSLENDEIHDLFYNKLFIKELGRALGI